MAGILHYISGSSVNVSGLLVYGFNFAVITRRQVECMSSSLEGSINFTVSFYGHRASD